MLQKEKIEKDKEDKDTNNEDDGDEDGANVSQVGESQVNGKDGGEDEGQLSMAATDHVGTMVLAHDCRMLMICM